MHSQISNKSEIMKKILLSIYCVFFSITALNAAEEKSCTVKFADAIDDNMKSEDWKDIPAGMEVTYGFLVVIQPYKIIHKGEEDPNEFSNMRRVGAYFKIFGDKKEKREEIIKLLKKDITNKKNSECESKKCGQMK